MTSLEFTFWLANQLGETEPRQKFYLWSSVTLVGQQESIKMLERAVAVYEYNKDHSLAGWWYQQMPDKHERITYRIRQYTRQLFNLEPHSIPEYFN